MLKNAFISCNKTVNQVYHESHKNEFSMYSECIIQKHLRHQSEINYLTFHSKFANRFQNSGKFQKIPRHLNFQSSLWLRNTTYRILRCHLHPIYALQLPPGFRLNESPVFLGQH